MPKFIFFYVKKQTTTENYNNINSYDFLKHEHVSQGDAKVHITIQWG